MKSLLVFSAVLLCGCAHQDLKAPCATLAARDNVARDTIPCAAREPVQQLAFALPLHD